MANQNVDIEAAELKLKYWLVFQVVLPLLFVILVWPMGKYIFEMKNSYIQTFAGADLLIFGGMLCFGMIVDLSLERRLPEKELVNYKITCYLVGTLCLFFYGFLKAKAMSSNGPENEVKLAPLASFCLMAGVFISVVNTYIAYGMISKLKIVLASASSASSASSAPSASSASSAP